MNKEILSFCSNKGFLLDNDLLKVFDEVEDIESIKIFIEQIIKQTSQRIITKKILRKNKEKVEQIFLNIPNKNKKTIDKLKIKLGLSIEIIKENEIMDNFVGDGGGEGFTDNPIKNPINKEIEKPQKSIKLCADKKQNSFESVKIMFANSFIGKKLEVKNFVNYFKNRFVELKNILQENSCLKNLVSINKISENRQGISIIGIVSDKKITKNKNILFELEDLTGKIKVLINNSKKELYEKAEEITLDSVIGINCSGNREIVFVNDIVFPEAMILERKKSLVDESALFIGDLHFGSKLFLKENFLKFIDYLNEKVPNTPEVKKIKYLFIVGDIITGVGNYPNQEKDLEIKDIEEQFLGLVKLLKQIREDIIIIISPGNHDCVRLIEPQPLFDEKYAWPLYDMKNVILTTNPCNLNIGAIEGFSGFDVLTYHGFSFPYYANNVSKLILKNAMNCPEEIMKYLLKNRHLAPTHKSVQYFPLEKDPLVIKNIPDIFVAAHTHKSAVSYYNNILVISTSCWEAMTPYQEKFGNTPDHCKVPMFNLKTREIKILDFE